MKSLRLFLIPLVLISLVLVTCCGLTQKHRDLHWHGETWDGMNRMVFSLQDLGWHVENVDTDNGTIVATRPLRGGDAKAGGQAGNVFRILIQFPEGAEFPITVSPDGREDDASSTPEFQRMVHDITKRFIWYGGNSLEVRED